MARTVNSMALLVAVVIVGVVRVRELAIAVTSVTSSMVVVLTPENRNMCPVTRLAVAFVANVTEPVSPPTATFDHTAMDGPSDAMELRDAISVHVPPGLVVGAVNVECVTVAIRTSPAVTPAGYGSTTEVAEAFSYRDGVP
jgi:hypothetical protein